MFLLFACCWCLKKNFHLFDWLHLYIRILKMYWKIRYLKVKCFIQYNIFLFLEKTISFKIISLFNTIFAIKCQVTIKSDVSVFFFKMKQLYDKIVKTKIMSILLKIDKVDMLNIYISKNEFIYFSFYLNPFNSFEKFLIILINQCILLTIHNSFWL